MRIGVVLPRDLPDTNVITFARNVDELGFDNLWVVEDLGYKGGFAQAGAVLAATSRVRVGIGVLPVAARNPVFTAMEAATLANLFPGRITLGVGHGMPVWMRQVGIAVDSPLTLLAETLDAVRGLLAGDTVSIDGRYVHLDAVRLEAPPALPPVVLAGVRGPRSMEVSGEHADGTLLAEPVTVEYLEHTRTLTKRGVARRPARQKDVSSAAEHQLHAYNVAWVDDDPDVARDRVRQTVAVFGQPDWWPHIASLPFAEAFKALAAQHRSTNDLARLLPAEWIDELAIVGTAATVRRRLADLNRAGAASCSYFVDGAVTSGQLSKLAAASNMSVRNR
ncbi:LLM class flavin-dependent oxidoreductase [Nocardioides mangrovicus]|uniref:LLM class flavin-dependent oxidoreductase n=1 Tax=Nocardioides mangrovicus TaxID=2478913 RepID=A0A3L8P3Q1_9ACTN|nr:LLM class flavin-dependent oxidoreductase [Nocardioides mangrovicus]RLV49731.1 LLM class flavin-dependent oxidoreductase [Nocardioides mangrovicus]